MHKRGIRTALITLSLAATAVLSACGSSSGDGADGFLRVQDTGTSITTESLLATGFKQSKSYSVEGLPGASSALFGFWRAPGKDPLDFEVRFYSSYADAVELGTGPAEEGTGDDAVLDKESANYKEGVKDRRTIIGTGSGGGARSGIGPKYADFVIYNNIIILCPGGQVEHSLERCAAFIEAISGS